MTGGGERLDLIEARADAAMPGPWAATRTLLRSGCVGIAVHQRAGGTFVMVDRDREVRMEDAEFMAAARDDVPWLIGQLCDARAEIERLRESTTELAHAKAKIDNLLRDNHDLCRTIADLHAELAAERAKVQRVEALCDEYRTNCDPDTKQAQVAEMFRAALTEGETGE